jgi:hypothetical protein
MFLVTDKELQRGARDGAIAQLAEVMYSERVVALVRDITGVKDIDPECVDMQATVFRKKVHARATTTKSVKHPSHGTASTGSDTLRRRSLAPRTAAPRPSPLVPHSAT